MGGGSNSGCGGNVKNVKRRVLCFSPTSGVWVCLGR